MKTAFLLLFFTLSSCGPKEDGFEIHLPKEPKSTLDVKGCWKGTFAEKDTILDIRGGKYTSINQVFYFSEVFNKYLTSGMFHIGDKNGKAVVTDLYLILETSPFNALKDGELAPSPDLKNLVIRNGKEEINFTRCPNNTVI
jgi:hypothetical protein